jgi:hypothetical protein
MDVETLTSLLLALWVTWSPKPLDDLELEELRKAAHKLARKTLERMGARDD